MKLARRLLEVKRDGLIKGMESSKNKIILTSSQIHIPDDQKNYVIEIEKKYIDAASDLLVSLDKVLSLIDGGSGCGK